MVTVSNRGCIRRLSLKSMKAARTRNLIAILAIALTTVLFTSLFTIAMSINDGFQQNNFRQVGGYSHGGFKYLTEQQFNELKDDPLIQDWGLRRFIGMPQDVPFNKSHVEIGYGDATYARWSYCVPVEGRLPEEGTQEAATDTHVLELLGIQPELGAQFSVTFYVDGKPTTQTFTLCGWWEYDEAIVANHILLPESRVNSILDEMGVVPPGSNGRTGTRNLDVMFRSSMHIEQDMKEVLQNHGYQSDSRADADSYIAIGVNWGYTGSQLFEKMDIQVVAAIAAVLLLIVFTGYLIIYNVFQISVSNDIRFYGLLKTIGTTPRQLRRIIRQQALLLSLVGIPLGLFLGWLVGAMLTPAVIGQLNSVKNTVSVNPVIFVGAALFTLLTVLLSCRKPGAMAAKVSPVEAVRYTEGGKASKKKMKKSSKGAGLFAMARANLGRNRGKTAVTIVSLALAVVLLNLTVTFAGGFDMDRYLSGNVVSDFILADASYFQVGADTFSAGTALPEDAIDAVAAQGGITAGGRIYGCTSDVQEFISEDYYRSVWERWYDSDTLEQHIQASEHNEEGLLADRAQLYGMERFALDHLELLEGDLSKLDTPGSRYIAAVYSTDDYGKPRMDSHWARVGDIVTLRYVEELEYYHPDTGEVYGAWENVPEDVPFASRAIQFREVEYEVAALVSVPTAISYRYYGADEFVLNDQTFRQDTGTDSVMLYAFDTADENANAAMEAFLSSYTEHDAPQYNYESKATYVAEFESMRSMFLMLGGALSFIVGLVGILNFFNAVLTGILTRKREFAVLQSVGMTGKQLKRMLVWEGFLYALGAVAVAVLFSIVLGPLLGTAVSSMFWFFVYRFTLLPILCIIPVFALLGAALPLIVYRSVARHTIVERLRESE